MQESKEEITKMSPFLKWGKKIKCTQTPLYRLSVTSKADGSYMTRLSSVLTFHYIRFVIPVIYVLTSQRHAFVEIKFVRH